MEEPSLSKIQMEAAILCSGIKESNLVSNA